MEAAPEGIFVAVDGTDIGLSGVRWAAQESQRLGLDLTIVHVVQAFFPIRAELLGADGVGDSVNQYGRATLTAARAVAQTIAPELTVSTLVITGGRVDSIVYLARMARLLVLGSHPRTIAEWFWGGATVPGVAARAGCPVLVVQQGQESRERMGRIMVCIKSPNRSVALLESAFAQAQHDQVGLRILHAWKLPPVYDEFIANPGDLGLWNQQQQAIIERVLTDTRLRTRYPDVSVQIQIVEGPSARVLIDQSRTVDRLLMSRPVHGGYFHHLGSTARAVLRGAHCPVEVFPPAGQPAAQLSAEHREPDVLPLN